MVDYTNPIDMTEEDLVKKYRETWHSASGNHQKDIQANLLVAEINRRQAITTNRDSRRWTKLSLCLSILALSLASLSAYFSYTDWRSDFDWQKEQISELQKANQHLKKLASEQ